MKWLDITLNRDPKPSLITIHCEYVIQYLKFRSLANNNLMHAIIATPLT